MAGVLSGEEPSVQDAGLGSNLAGRLSCYCE